MTRVYYFGLLLCFVLLIYSCRINGSFQGLYGYQDIVSKEHPELIIKSKVDICDASYPETPIVYAINGKELKKCIENTERSLIYLWSPNCSSKLCIPLKYIQNTCDKHKIELYIVAEYYDYEKMTANYLIERPIFGIDCNYYKTNLTKFYRSKFLNEVVGLDLEMANDMYFLFNYEKLITKGSSIETILKT